MRKPVANFMIPSPMHVFDENHPTVVARVTLDELCSLAGIPNRVTGPAAVVCLTPGKCHWRSPGARYVGVGGGWKPGKPAALRILEVLAHGFHDYAARECICGRGLFAVPTGKPGRKPIGAKSMTAAERMRRMREMRAAGK